MKKFQFKVLLMVIVVAMASFWWFLPYITSSPGSMPSSTYSPGASPLASPSIPSAGELMTVKGTFTCLPHKNTSGPQTMECAFGLQASNGVYYAVRDSDPTYKNVSSVGTNSQVEVTGHFTPQTDTKYQSIGILEITELKKLGNTNVVNSFEDCAAAGNPVMESYPRQCNTPEGKHFVEELKQR